MLTPGSRLGVYEVVSSLGAGGMGEVYRARDAKLGRDVALKILPDAVAADADRVARFEREARTLAALNHPHIAQIYGFEQSGGVSALVMELVEGEDLAVRIARGAIPIDEALPIALQIAEALEAAHDAGVIHRDLKPANIKLRPDGTVKVLDFGLAKAVEQHSGIGPTSGSPVVAPTITTPAMTAAGLILGTAAYMSPEQAKGRVVDRRADVWAFGCVLYEMLTGSRAFAGDDISDTMVAIFRDDPDWTALPPTTPPHIRRLVQRCLQKDVRKRLPHIGVARLELVEGGEVSAIDGQERVAQIEVTPSVSNARRFLVPLAWTLLGATIVAGAVSVMRARPDDSRGAVRFEVLPPTGGAFPGGFGVPRFAISPDGRRLAYQAIIPGSGAHLLVRRLDSTDSVPIPGTMGDNVGNNAQQPFWSPDGQQVGFFDETAGQLRRWHAQSGLTQVVCDVPGNQPGGSWNEEGTIIFATAGTKGIHRVSAAGGQATPVTTLDTSRQELSHLWPEFLPDGRHFLYLVAHAGDAPPAIYVASLDGGAPTRLIESRFMARFAPPNRLLFVRDNALMWQPFDPDRLRLSGEPSFVVNTVLKTAAGRVAMSASRNGVLVYAAGVLSADPTEGDQSETAWVDRGGREVTPQPPSASVGNVGLRLSPDGELLAFGRFRMSAGGSQNLEYWVQDVTRGVESRLTTDEVNVLQVVFSPDGSRVVLRRPVGPNVHAVEDHPVSRATAGRVIFQGAAGEHPVAVAWTPDNQLVYLASRGPERGIWIRPLAGDGESALYVKLDRVLSHAALSPDGRWLAFADGPGDDRRQIVLQTFPDPTLGRWVVSGPGGDAPRWRQDGRELFFLDGNQWLSSVTVTTEPRFEIGPPTRLFELTRSPGVAYDVAPDGKRFVIIRPKGEPKPTALTVAVDWMSEGER